MFSVVITSHRNAQGLYLTYFAIREQLERQHPNNWEIIIVADGGSEAKWENLSYTKCIRGNFGSPQASRDAGIKAAMFNTVVVMEDHVIVSDIEELVMHHWNIGSTMTFPTRRFETNEFFNVYGALTDWSGDLWYKRLVYEKPPGDEPYKVSQFGQSCFVIDREWYIKNGGYTDLFTGWGGEEPFLCLKAWMLGGSLWIVPSVYHAHFLTAGAHGDTMASGDFRHNFDIVKYVITGVQTSGLRMNHAIEAERRRICAGPFGGSVSELRKYFGNNGVLN